jgi:hypothetical protein
MRRLPVAVLLTAVSLTAYSPLFAQSEWYTEGDYSPSLRVRVTVANTLDFTRQDCPVVIRRDTFPVASTYEMDITVVDPLLPPDSDPTPEQAKAVGSGISFRETNGHHIPYQLDDLDKDGLWDELFFMSDFRAKETRTFYIYFGKNERGVFAHETHAEIGNYGRHLVPWWESGFMGWKLWYFSDVDLYGKRQPRLVANHENTSNLSGYTAGSEFGNDIMTVEDTFGCGGICLFEHPDTPGKVSRPRFSPNRGKGQLYDTRCAYDVVVNGPLRSMIRAHIMNWQSGKGMYELEQVFTAFARKSYYTCRVNFLRFQSEIPGTMFGCGIRKIMNEVRVYQKGGTVISFGKDVDIFDPDVQERFATRLLVGFEGTALVVKDRYSPVYQETGEFEGGHAFRIPVTDDQSFEYLVAAAWSEGTVNRTPQEFQSSVLKTAREYNTPVVAGDYRLERKGE